MEDKQINHGAGVGLLVSTLGTQMTGPVYGQTSSATSRILMEQSGVAGGYIGDCEDIAFVRYNEHQLGLQHSD